MAIRQMVIFFLFLGSVVVLETILYKSARSRSSVAPRYTIPSKSSLQAQDQAQDRAPASDGGGAPPPAEDPASMTGSVLQLLGALQQHQPELPHANGSETEGALVADSSHQDRR